MQPKVPKFNVVEPFQGVFTVQMNAEMGKLISDFIEDIDGGVEREIVAFGKALQNPAKSRELRTHKKRVFYQQQQQEEEDPRQRR